MGISISHRFWKLIFKFILSINLSYSWRFSISRFLCLTHILRVLYNWNFRLIFLSLKGNSWRKLMSLLSLFLHLWIFLLIILFHFFILIFSHFLYFIIISPLLILHFILLDIFFKFLLFSSILFVLFLTNFNWWKIFLVRVRIIIKYLWSILWICFCTFICFESVLFLFQLTCHLIYQIFINNHFLSKLINFLRSVNIMSA